MLGLSPEPPKDSSKRDAATDISVRSKQDKLARRLLPPPACRSLPTLARKSNYLSSAIASNDPLVMSPDSSQTQEPLSSRAS